MSRPFAAPEAPTASERFVARLRSPGVRRGAGGFLATAVTLVLLGAPIGLIWAAVSPHPEYVLTATSVNLVTPETKAFVAADGIFFVLSLAVGIACGVGAHLLARHRGPAVAAGLAVGGVLAALVAWKVGAMVGHDSFVHLVRTGRDGLHVHGYVFVRAHGVLLAWGFAALVAFGGCVLCFDRAERRAAAPTPTSGEHRPAGS